MLKVCLLEASAARMRRVETRAKRARKDARVCRQQEDVYRALDNLPEESEALERNPGSRLCWELRFLFRMPGVLCARSPPQLRHQVPIQRGRTYGIVLVRTLLLLRFAGSGDGAGGGGEIGLPPHLIGQYFSTRHMNSCGNVAEFSA